MMAIAEQINNIKSLSQQLYERDNILAQEHRRLKTFNKIIVKANESTNQKELVQGILEACIDFIDFDIGGIYLVSSGKSHIVATKFVPVESLDTLNEICVSRPELKDLFKFGKPIHIKNYDLNYPETSRMLGGIKSLISVPVLYNNHVKGCINIGAFENKSIGSDDCDILRTLGKHLGHVLHRLEVERELEAKILDLEVHAEELGSINENLLNAMRNLEQSQEQLVSERQNFHNLFTKITDMIFVTSLDNKIIAINDAVKTTCGDVIGEPMGYSEQLTTIDGSILPIDTRVVKGLWDGSDALYHVSRVR